MSANEYGGRTPRNIIGPGNLKNSGDMFNSFMKPERRPDPAEYATSTVEEYKEYAERRVDTDERPSEKRSREANSSDRFDSTGARRNSGRAGGSGNAGRSRGNLLKQVVGLVAGSVIVVNSYNVLAEKEALAAENKGKPGITEMEPGTQDEQDTGGRQAQTIQAT